MTDIKGKHDKEYFFEAEGCWIMEWWNRPEDEAVSIARARVEPGVITSWHCLEDIAERYLILQGRGCVEVGEQPPREVAPGEVVTIPAGVRQRIKNTGDKDLVFLAICTPRFRSEAYQSLVGAGLQPRKP